MLVGRARVSVARPVCKTSKTILSVLETEAV